MRGKTKPNPPTDFERSIMERNKTTWIILNVSTTFHLPQSQKWPATAASVGKVVINSWKQGILVGNTRQLCIGVATAPRIIMISFEQVNFDAAFYPGGCHLAEHTLEPDSRSAVARGWGPRRGARARLVRINVSLLSPAVNLGQMYPALQLDCPSANGVSLQRNHLYYTLWGLLELHKALFAFYPWKLFLRSVACQ